MKKKKMPIVRPRPAIIVGGIAKIPIGANAKHGYAIVDIENAWISIYPWCLNNFGYAMTKSTNIDGKGVLMHRFIMRAKNSPRVIDHIDRDKLNNRKSNLRLTTQKVNTLNSNLRKDNTSGQRGVVWDKNRNKWLVRIGDGKHIGRFDEYPDAVEARLNAEINVFGMIID